MSEGGYLQTVVSKIYYALISERDWSAAEIYRLLLNLNLAHSSRDYVIVDCRPENEYALLLVSDNNSLMTDISILNKYKQRQLKINNVIYLNFLLHYSYDSKSLFTRRPWVRSRILCYMS